MDLFLGNVSDHITQADLGFYLGGLVGLAEIYTMRICRKLTLLKLSKNKKWSSGWCMEWFAKESLSARKSKKTAVKWYYNVNIYFYRHVAYISAQ